MTNFYDTNLGQVQTPLMLTMRGLPIDADFLRGHGIFQVTYMTPLHNDVTQAIEPDGAPVMNEAGTTYVQAFTVVALPLERAQQNLKLKVTARRWQVETGGLTLPDGTRINTGIDDQNRISSALQGMADAGIAEVDFKGVDGWVKLSREQLTGIAALIAGHVQACFSRERALHELVDACESLADLQSVDINSGWPGELEAAQ